MIRSAALVLGLVALPFADGCGNPEPSALAMASMLWPVVFPREAGDFPLLAGKTVNYGSKIQCARELSASAFRPAERAGPEGDRDRQVQSDGI